MKPADVIAAAKRRARADARARRDERYLAAMGTFVHAGLLSTNADLEPVPGPVLLSHVLWAGRVEPRLLELLPAVLVKRPSVVSVDEMPHDLEGVVWSLRHNEVPEDFRGIPGKKVAAWVPRVGHRNKLPTVLKSFRLRAEDVELLRELARARGVSETQVIRAGLRALREVEGR